MILLWLILTPLIGGVLAGFSGRRNNALSRWLSLVCLAIDLVLVLVLWATARRRSDHRQRDMACPDRLALDPAARHQASTWPGWPEPVADSPYPWARLHVGDRLLERDHRTCGLLSLQSDVDLGRCHRRLPCTRSLPVLLFLGIDAGSHVFPDRRLGARASDLCSNQVLSVHPGKRVADVRRHSRTRLHQLPPNGGSHIRLFRAGYGAARPDDANVAHARLLHRLRREAARRTVSYLAGRCSYRSADRRQRHPRGAAPEDRRLRAASLRRSRSSQRRRPPSRRWR